MNDRRYGYVFRQIREQKHFPLSYFEKVGVMKSNVARFERGEVMMSFGRVYSMLQAMNISLAEYEMLFNNYVPELQEQYLYELEKSYLFQDTNKLRDLYDEIKVTGNRLLTLVAKSKIKTLNDAEVKEILTYLVDVKQLGYFELSLTNEIVEYLKTSEMMGLLKEFKKSKSYYNNMMKYKRIIHQIAYAAVLVLSARKEKALSEEILKLTEKPRTEKMDFYIATYRKLTIAYNKYCFNQVEREEASKEINYALNLFEELGSKELRVFYENKVNRYLELVL